MIDIKSGTFEQIRRAVPVDALSTEAVRRAYLWAHAEGRTSWSGLEEMLPRRASEVRRAFDLSCLELAAERVSEIDGTRNLLFRLADGLSIESVLIPHWDNATLCVSSQAGCAMGCRFCETASLGLKRHLETWEIVDQLYRTGERAERRITDIVFMGMGEPLHNYDRVLLAADIFHERRAAGISARRITISTVGLVPQIHRFVDERRPYRLAFSITSALPEKRRKLMPITERYPLDELAEAIRRYAATLGNRRWVTVQYVAIEGWNLGWEDVRALGELLGDVPYIVDVVPFNPIATAPDLRSPSPDSLRELIQKLRSLKRPIKVRHSGGKDMGSGCGQLAATWDTRTPTRSTPTKTGGPRHESNRFV